MPPQDPRSWLETLEILKRIREQSEESTVPEYDYPAYGVKREESVEPNRSTPPNIPIYDYPAYGVYPDTASRNNENRSAERSPNLHAPLAPQRTEDIHLPTIEQPEPTRPAALESAPLQSPPIQAPQIQPNIMQPRGVEDPQEASSVIDQLLSPTPMADIPETAFGGADLGLPTRPNRDDYSPDIWERIIAGIVGAGVGIQGGAGAGYSAGRDVIDRPYNEALQDWQYDYGQSLQEAQLGTQKRWAYS